MVKRTNKPHRQQTKSELRRKKARRHLNFQKDVHITHEAINSSWDKKKTLQQNYEKLGLVDNVNDRRERKKQAERLATIDIDEDVNVLKNEMKKKEEERRQ